MLPYSPISPTVILTHLKYELLLDGNETLILLFFIIKVAELGYKEILST